MRKFQLSVIAPCLNEEQNVPELCARVLATFDKGALHGELVLVDDGSTDGTKDVIRNLEAAHGERVVGVFHPKNRGIAEAWRSGTDRSRGSVIALIDSDLQYQPEDLLRLYRALFEHSVDVVQGFRSPIGRARGSRYHLSRGFNFLLNRTFGMNLRDNKSGFIACSREVMADLLSYEGQYHYWQSFIMVASHAKGYSYKEIETLFEDRRAGKSFLDDIAYRASARSVVDLARATWEYRLAPKATSTPIHRSVVPPRAEEPPSPARRVLWNAYMASFDSTHWMITRAVEDHYDTLRGTQWLPPSALRSLQDEKLSRLLRHAYRHVPFYRDRMQKAGVRPEDIRGQEDLHKLPYLTKDDVRAHLYFDILSDNHDKDKVLRISTSGSTGEPFVCYADRAQLEFRWAATLRSQEWTGYRFGDPCVRLWHQSIGMTNRQRLRELCDAKLSRRTFVPLFEMSDGNLAQMIRRIEEADPVLIDGYAEAFDFIARYLVGKGEKSTIAPKAIMTSAQTLPDGSRRLIERAFGCEVFDKYGSREFSGIAYECEAHTGHHVVGEGYIVEILKAGVPAKPGEIGEVFITDLNNTCLPFIRYRIGDLAVAVDPAVPCPCGRGLPLIGAIEGRVQSIIVGADGRYLPGAFFAHFLKEYGHAIRLFQVEQDRPNHILFRIVRGGRFSNETLEEILAVFRRFLGPIEIEVEFVENVAMIQTGKRMASVSRLGVDFQRAALHRAEPLVR